MSRRVSGPWLAVTAVLCGLALALLLILNAAFGGPGGGGGDGRQFSATFPDSQGLVAKSLVLVRGVRVGEVARLKPVGDAVRVTLAVEPGRTPVYRDARVRVGHRTLFGEAYVSLDPGTPTAGPLPDGATLPRSRVTATVEVDEALRALGPGARGHLGSLARTGAQVAAEPRSAARLNATLAGLAATTTGLRSLTDALRGQDGELTGLVRGGREVVDELSARDAQLRTLVGGARISAGALAADAGALRGGLAEASALLQTTRSTLRTSAPLLREATPVLRRVSAAAPPVAASLRALPSVVSATRRAITALPAARRAAGPTLQLARAAAPTVTAAIGPLTRALQDLDPTLRYAAPYKGEIVGFVASGEGVRALRPDGTATSATLADTHYQPFEAMGDPGAPYGWARFFVEANAGVLTASGAGIGNNPYPAPGDPYGSWSGAYPQLRPSIPPAP
jgi:phospholipid/cholesterol/gamma-HCH transport system substrate-binding protein